MDGNELKHVGVIMDGNRRWARKNKLQSVLNGHEKGVDKFMEICTWCLDHGIPYLTVYAFSTENWNRSEAEINGLFAIMERFFTNRLSDCLQRGIRIVVAGDRSRLNEKQRSIIEQAEEKTRQCSRLLAQIGISYGGRDELVRAMKKTAADIRAGRLTAEKITEEEISANLDSAGIPMIDMVIRTGGNHRLSNFFIWQSAYAEIYFTDTLWPDFSEKEFSEFVDDYKTVKINLGK